MKSNFTADFIWNSIDLGQKLKELEWVIVKEHVRY